MGLEPDAEALIVNRMADPPEHAIAPIDECYRLVGMIKLEWDGISGGAGVERAIETFFGELRERARRVSGRDRPDADARAARPFTGAPDPDFEILRATPVEHAAAPTLSFTVRASDDSERRVFTIAATAVISIEPSKRRYDAETRERLFELFGEPQRWASTTTNFRWAQAEALVGPFTGSTEFELVVPCTYDLELAATKYFRGLADGEAPLRFHFNGTVFYESDDGRMQIVQIPWDRSPRFRMPVEAWRRTIDAVYPYRAWIPLDSQTLDRLERRKAERGLPTFDAVLGELLAEDEA